MSEIKRVIEELFNVREDEQKIKAGSCKIVCSLEPSERALLEAQITARLQHLLDQEPTHALLVCQRCEGCPALRRVLRGPCWAVLLRVCLEHLGAQQDGQPWPSHHLPRAVRVLYIVLKEQPTQDHHQDCHQNTQQKNQHLTKQHQLDSQQQGQVNDLQYETATFRPLLDAARVTLTLALLDGGSLASGSHALVASTTLCLLLQYLEQKGSIIAFLDTLWILNHLAEKRKVMTNTFCGRNTDVRYDDEEMSGMKDHFRSPEKVKESTANVTIKKSISVTSSLRWEDVRTAIESARRGDEGRKLMKRNFEGMEGSYSSSTLLLQGMLNAGGKLLIHESEEEEGHRGRIFLFSLHPLLLKLCSGGATQHTFQAFQTLYLWIRAVRELGSRERRHTGRTKHQGPESDSSGQMEEWTLNILPTSTITTTNATTTCPMQGASHPSKHALFSMAPGSQGPVFTLLNASWENPAKGVSELVVKCMEELLSLHEDGTEGARQQLARDILQALLYSSSSSVTSVWTSKSTYPPLALALTHLGCQEALHLYPSLPASLVSSLGVNHLAPATTTVYKVFLAQLGVSSWSQHFLTPISVVLSSEDRLTQQHLLSLWLPPTLKKYPGIHWALLASCSNTTPGWLSRMALLRTARSVGALELGEQGSSAFSVSCGNTYERSSMEAASNSKESETEEALIMPHIHTALSHRDENVRLEALSLLCHTQKTSQPVSHFETVCLQNFLRWNMNIDSAPFRQGVLKCVAALLVRLRGATASYCKSQNNKGVRSTVKKTAKEPTLTHNRNQKCGVVEVSCSTVLSTSAELVMWLVREVHRAMAPDANYQRRILALQLYKEVLLALLPSYTAVPHLGKRVTSSPDSLLLHLNTMTAKKSTNHLNNTSDGKDKEGNPSLHSLSPELDIYGDRKALDQPLIDLAFPWTLHTLLHLCIDEMNDVRAEAREIIHIFTSQGRMALSCSEGRKWMRRAMKLCDSPKASDAESGGTLALTVALLIPEEHLNEVLEGMSGMESEEKGGGGGGCESSETNTPSSWSLGEYLLARVECQFSVAKTNLLWAARHAPIHGTLQALGQYITQKQEEEQEEVKKKIQQKKEGKKKENEVAEKAFIPAFSPSFLPYLTSLLQHLVEFVLDTLASTSPLGSAVPPSFAEMGEAVRKVVEEGKEKLKEDEKSNNVALSSVTSLLEQEKEEDVDREEEGGLLSSDHVLVLSCCWQILKSCCEVTSRLIHLLAGEPKAADDLIRVVVVRVLLGTRHKGAMEAARATYASLWSCLLQNDTLRGPFGVPDSCFVDILHWQVGEVLHMLGAPRGTSVTRRAAGVAMMVQAACGAAPRLTPTLLTTTVASLTTTACSQVGMDESGTTDAPQALALHVLQSLVLHSPLSPFLRPHLTSLTSTCLHAFASLSWAIRNAALQLFGSLVSSLVGQKKVRDDTSALNSLTTPEFVSRHPSLVQLLLSALSGDSECHTEGSEDSKVAPGTLTDIQDTDTLPPPVIQLSKDTAKHTDRPYNTKDTHNQNHTPTHMHIHIKSASILVPVLSLVARLSPGTGLQQNPHLTRTLERLWHSTACLLESPVYNVRRLAALALVSLTPSNQALPRALKLLLKASDPITTTNLIHGHLLALSNFLQTHPNLAEESKLRKSASASLAWLFSPRNICHINTALALKIMMVLNINIMDACHIPALDSSLPGAAECRSTLTLMKLSHWPRNTIESLFLSEAPIRMDLLEICSDAILYEIKDCHCASWLLKCESCFWHHLEESILTPKAMAAILQFLTVIMEKVESAGSSIPTQGLAVLLSCMKGLQGSSATYAALVLLAHLMRHPANITEDILAAFAGVLSQHSHPTSSEDHRLAASVALKVAIKPIFTCHHQVSLTVRKQLVMSTVALLQDEDSLIRDTATGIVVALVTPSGAIQEHTPHSQPNPHPNLALFEFFRYLADKSMTDSDWTILRILWEVCFGEEGSKSFFSATTLTASHLRLFQSHAANLYHEPRQVSISVGVALMKTIEEHRQTSVWESQQQNTSWNKHQAGKDSKSQENTNIGQENGNPSQFSVRDWLEKESAKLNCQGEALFSMASNHNFWHHRQLAFEAGVYVVSCKVFKLLCEVFGVSPELAYLLVWSEKGYGTVDEMG
ncbi:uncharacterized protein LOC123515715 [Portunus trituberculatus]|uniref:uncharacterized protein LOC123515715 n=1 Tax=Portunus trituberculatus TaxID=210409 RepID=UPI001E1CC5F5|nr:uncharacterized protein LOC123515715 [Portunus trituberculatus]